MTEQFEPALERAIDDLFERPRVNVVTIANVEPEQVQWLWADRIPFGGLTLLDGDPGTGKTTAALDVIARVTTGAPMPDGTPVGAPGDAVILTVEDVLATTIRPRLEVAGADLARVHAITGIPDGDGERPLTLPADWDAIIAASERTGAVMVFLDPLMALLGGDTNSFRDQDVRRALVPGIRAAERLSFALVVTRHLNKSGGANPLYRGGGSIGLIAAARSAMLMAPDPEDDTGTRRILAMTKHNLAPRAPSLAYTIAPVVLDGDVATTCIVWTGTSKLLATDLLAEPDGDHAGSALNDAIAFLREALQSGPQPVRAIEREATVIGIKERTLRRAREKLEVLPEKHGFGQEGYWCWRLPHPTTTPKAPNVGNGHLSSETDADSRSFPHVEADSTKVANAGYYNDDQMPLGTLANEPVPMCPGCGYLLGNAEDRARRASRVCGSAGALMTQVLPCTDSLTIHVEHGYLSSHNRAVSGPGRRPSPVVQVNPQAAAQHTHHPQDRRRTP